MQEYYTVNEVARILKCTPITIHRLCKSGEIKAFKLNRTWRIPARSLNKFNLDGEDADASTERKG